MANSMFESILGMVTPEMTQSIAGRLGESPSAIQHGLSAATAATLNGLARNSSDARFTDQLTQIVSRASGQNLAGNVASMISSGPSGAAGDLSSRLTSLAFGSEQGHIANLVSQHSGLSSSAGSGVLKMAGALVLGHLARMHGAGNLNPSTLAGSLRSEASNLSSYVPGSFLAGLGGSAGGTVGGTVSDAAARTSSYASNVIHAEGPRIAPATSAKWVAPTLAVLAGAAVVGWLVHRFTRAPARIVAVTQAVPHVVTNAANTATNTVANVAAAPLGRLQVISLPNGTQLNVPSNGVEVRLVQYLQSPSTRTSDLTWFNFDRLLFDNGRATLQPQSNEQLDNVAAILKAYPSAKIRLGGYTDNTGNAAANTQLSEQRADTVMAALVQRGIDPSRLSARGYGDQYPIADNSTPAGRQRNRRIAIRVASK